MAEYSIMDIIAGLEAKILADTREVGGAIQGKRCNFYFGEDQRSRLASAPKVIWEIDGGDPTGLDGKAGYPRAYGADQVQCMALIVGEGRVPGGDVRRAEFAASEHLLRVLEGALKDLQPGRSERLGWKTLWPEGDEDKGVPIEVQFWVKVSCLQPSPPTVVPDSVQSTPHVES